MITLDGFTLESFGLTPQPGAEFEVIAETEDRTVKIPLRDGALDFGANLKERIFLFPLIWAKEINRVDLQKKVREFASFLVDENGEPRNIKLSFDYEPEKYFTARYVGDNVPERLLNMVSFELPMIAFDPIAYAEITAFDENNQYDSGLLYDDGLFYDNPDSFDWVYSKHTSGVHNYSKIKTPLNLTITGAVTNPTITNEDTGESIGFTVAMTAGQKLIIKGKPFYTVTLDGANALNLLTSGDFMYLQKGSNGLTFSGVNPNATVTYNWLHKFV